jgi:hypothetical protein
VGQNPIGLDEALPDSRERLKTSHEDHPFVCIAGARPNFMKIAPLIEELRNWPCFPTRLIHTGQHFSPEMSDVFSRDLGIPEPDENLEIGSGTQIEQAAAILTALESSLCPRPPDSLSAGCRRCDFHTGNCLLLRYENLPPKD